MRNQDDVKKLCSLQIHLRSLRFSQILTNSLVFNIYCTSFQKYLYELLAYQFIFKAFFPQGTVGNKLSANFKGLPYLIPLISLTDYNFNGSANLFTL